MKTDKLIARIEKMKVMSDPSNPQMRQALTRIGSVLQAEIRLNIRKEGLIDQGYLLNSIKYLISQSKNKAVLEVGSFGVPYAPVHEFGYRGSQSVPAHQRLQKIAFGRPIKNPKLVNVSAHIRQQNIPARPYIRPALQKFNNFIIDTLRAMGNE